MFYSKQFSFASHLTEWVNKNKDNITVVNVAGHIGILILFYWSDAHPNSLKD